MSTRFVTVDRVTALLLPPDMREWVTPDDPVHLILALVNEVPMNAFSVNVRGSGSKQYPPSMMLALLIHCYSEGVFSSRRIERATYRDVSVRYLTGDTHPDHDTIAKFRRDNGQAIAAAFLKVLVYARETGMLKLGAVSVDGTLIKANASKRRNVRFEDLPEYESYLKEQVARLLEKAEVADAQDEDSDALPAELTDLQALQAKVRKAREKIEARDQDRRQRERANSRRERGKPKETPEEAQRAIEQNATKPVVPKAEACANLTDVDSRLMRHDPKSSFEQGYNAQAVADADGSQLILGTRIANASNDFYELQPNIEALSPELRPITAVLADSGYANQEQVEALESQGLDLYVSVRSEPSPRHPGLPAKENPRDLSVIAKTPFGQRMYEKLRTDAGRALYKRRRHTIEPCFGIIKHVLGFRQFHLRGLAKVALEWELVALAYNVKMIYHAIRRKSGPNEGKSLPKSVVRVSEHVQRHTIAAHGGLNPIAPIAAPG